MWYLGPLTISIAICFFLHMGHTFPFLYMCYNFFFLENWHFINIDVLRCFNCVWFFVEPVNSNLPSSFVHGILQARILEWVAISYSRKSSWPRDRTCLTFLSCICRQVLYHLLLLCSNLETDFSTFSICYAAVYLMMYFLLLSNHNKLGGLRQIYYITIWRSEAENGFPWAKTRVTAWLLSFWRLERRICFLSFSSFSIWPIVSDLFSSSILKANKS